MAETGVGEGGAREGGGRERERKGWAGKVMGEGS